MRVGDEESMAMHHHGLGTWMRNNWGLWSGGPLARHFQERGIDHPDDMSSIILTSLWREMNGQPLRVEEQIAKHKQWWIDTAYPEDAVCPIHGAKLEHRGASGLSQEPRKWVHNYRCEGNAETWHWQADRGFFQADEVKQR